MTQLEPVEKKEIKTIVDYIKLDSIVESVEKNLGNRGQQFLTSILSFANSNPAIMECEPRSVYTACLTAATLDLPINQNLGFAYIVPYYNNKTRRKEAQFQMGYKGFVQLAIRTGKYLRLGANAVYEGQLVGLDDFTGEPTFNFNNKTSDKVIGYMSYFRLLTGFEKSSFMSLEKMKKHANKYSQSFKKGYGMWKDDFDEMAKKTVLKLLLSKSGLLSTDMARAVEEDQKVGDEYADNKVSFEVEDAKVGDEPVEATVVDEQPDEELDEKLEAERAKQEQAAYEEFHQEEALIGEPPTKKAASKRKPAPKTELQRLKSKAFAMLNNLPEDVQAVAEEGRITLLGKKSRSFYTLEEVEKWIAYLESFEETNV